LLAKIAGHPTSVDIELRDCKEWFHRGKDAARWDQLVAEENAMCIYLVARKGWFNIEKT